MFWQQKKGACWAFLSIAVRPSLTSTPLWLSLLLKWIMTYYKLFIFVFLRTIGLASICCPTKKCRSKGFPVWPLNLSLPEIPCTQYSEEVLRITFHWRLNNILPPLKLKIGLQKMTTGFIFFSNKRWLRPLRPVESVPRGPARLTALWWSPTSSIERLRLRQQHDCERLLEISQQIAHIWGFLSHLPAIPQ